MLKEIRILDCVILICIQLLPRWYMLLLVLLTFRNVYVYDIEQEKMLSCKHLAIFIKPFFSNGPVLYLLKMSENFPGFQMDPGGTRIDHWEVNGLTHVVLFY